MFLSVCSSTAEVRNNTLPLLSSFSPGVKFHQFRVHAQTLRHLQRGAYIQPLCFLFAAHAQPVSWQKVGLSLTLLTSPTPYLWRMGRTCTQLKLADAAASDMYVTHKGQVYMWHAELHTKHMLVPVVQMLFWHEILQTCTCVVFRDAYLRLSE